MARAGTSGWASRIPINRARFVFMTRSSQHGHVRDVWLGHDRGRHRRRRLQAALQAADGERRPRTGHRRRRPRGQEAGLKAGDQIIAINGTQLDSAPMQANRVIFGSAVGDALADDRSTARIKLIEAQR